MAEYEISHPRIPQIGNTVLEGPDDLPPPTERDFWNVVQRQVRPFGLSQLTDEEKISAYKNGYFDEPEPVEGQPEQPGIVDSLLDLGGKAVLRGSQMANVLTAGTIGHSGPYDKLLKLEDEAVSYEKTENADQFREAGKYLFGFLDNTEEELDFDPVAEALKRTGMPFYSKNKNARGRVKTAAMDYAQDSMVAGMGEGYARAASGGEFLYKGGKFLKDKLLLDEADDSDILDYVNSSIEFDALNHRYENSAELAAFVLENPQESAKAMGAGLVGGLTPFVEAEDLNEILIDEEDINLDSDLQQDIRSGFVQPDVGVSFLSEVVGDPMNLAGGTTAKAVTAPQRVALSGRITKTLNEVNRLNKTKSSIAKELQKAQQRGEQSQRISRQARNLEAVNRQLANRQKILDKYGRNSLFLRMAAQSSPDELLKVAAKNIDTASDAGKASMNMVYNAMKPSGKIGLVRKGIAMGAKLTPEIAGATIGASMFGPEGAAAGALAPSILKGAKILSTMPENIAISYIMRSATEAGEEITEQAARKQYRQFTNRILYPTGILGLSGGAVLGSQEGGGGISDSLLKIGGGAFALKFLPKLAQFSDAAMRDSRVIGPELIYARGENSPFFNRLALLPSADEGLIGANADRFQALTRTSSGETILEKTINLVKDPKSIVPNLIKGAMDTRIGRGIVTSVKDEFPTGAPFRPGLSDTNKMLSDPTRKVAQFLDRTPTLGRGLETLGRFGTVVTAGSTLPAAFGYVGSGGQAEGALAGALVSAPFTSIGAGAGMFQSYKNKSDLFQQKMGDVYYYREHLNKSEQADFDALPMHIRMALSGYSLSHPDIMFQPGTEGRGNFSFNPDLQTSVVEYNKATGAGLIEGVLAHEVGHHIEIHGLTPMVNKLFFGDPVTKEGGVYGKFNDEGEIVPNKEFEDLRDFYLKRLSGDDSINPADADRYQGKEGQQLLVSELFAEQVRDYLLSGKKDKGNTVAQKIIRASSEAMMGTPFVRDFLLKMNLPMKADGKFIEGGFFEGKLRRIPEITKLIDQYYKDTRAMRQREIQGEEVTTPGTNRVDKELSIDSRKAKRPIEGEEFESSFSIKDQNDPAIKAKLDTGGVFKWRPTADGGSELETDATGTPKRYTAKELEKQNRAQGDHAIKVFEKNGVDIITHKDGKKSTGDITNLTPEMIDELAQGPWHPRQIQTLREISRSLREGDGERAGFLIGYFAASTGRKPKAVPFTLRQEMPYGFKLTKDGNILALLHDVPQLEKNLKFLKGGRRLPGKYRDEYNQLFDNDTEVWEAFRQYRVNTANGMDGQLGLDDDPSRAIRKKNFLNALHGAIDTEHINLNPILSEISKLKGMDMFNPSKRQPFGPATKTFRLDRIFDVTRSGNRNSNVNVDRAKKLLMPTEIQEGSPSSYFRPKSSRDTSAQVRTFKSPVYLKDGSRLSGVADNPEQNPFYGFDKSGQEFSQRREYINPQDITKSRDSDRTANQIRNELESGQKLFIPAYHGTPHTFSAEPGAPLGRFRTSAIGTGEGAQAYGHGLYFAGKQDVAQWYFENLNREYLYDGKEFDPSNPRHDAAKIVAKHKMDEMAALDELEQRLYLSENNPYLEKLYDIVGTGKYAEISPKGTVYKVELAPKENEYLLYDKTLGEQPKGVQDKLKKFLREQEGEDTWQYRKDQDYRDITNNVLEDMPEPEISRRLKEAGIPGIKYLDGSSRSKGEGDYNYVIFDEADVAITEKLFMPASEAGAGKGKVADAAKLWQEKGTDSPYFKKWFGKSKVVDENGDPLVVYHGTKGRFNEFERSRGGEFGSGMYFSENIDSAKMFGGFQAGDSEVVTMPAYLTLKNPLITSDRNIPRGAGIKSLIKKGYDGVIGTTPNGQKQYVAFSPEQIKSATGNRGTFDAGESNILFMPTQGDTTPASVQSWDGPNPTFGTNFTRGMVKDNKEAAALLRKSYEDQFGEPLRAQDFTEEQVNWLGDMFAKEGEAALGRTGNAVDWYTSAVERALAVAEEIFPDIGQKYEAKDRFLGALSITSQNMRVMDNAKGAVKQYQHKERTGKFDYSIKHGAKADAITKNLKLYDQAEAKMGAKDLHEFLDTDFTVKELSEWGRGFFGDKKFSIAGYSTDMVKGSAIFGPKIGQGFFQNLRGNYNPVTVDLWLRRTFGRLTGLALDTQLKPGDIGRLIYSVRKNVGKRKFSGLELPEFLKGVSITGKVQGNGVANFKISDQSYNRLFGDNTIGRDNYEAVYEFAGKLNKEWERRFATAGNDVTKAKKAIKAAKKEKKSTANLEKKLAKLEIEKEAIGKEKPQWAKAGSTVSDKLKPIDIPSNAERAVITKAFNVALKTLRDKGIDLTPADLQATLWYPEKDIWAFLKGENSDALNMSYDTAMEVIRDQR